MTPSATTTTTTTTVATAAPVAPVGKKPYFCLPSLFERKVTVGEPVKKEGSTETKTDGQKKLLFGRPSFGSMAKAVLDAREKLANRVSYGKSSPTQAEKEAIDQANKEKKATKSFQLGKLKAARIAHSKGYFGITSTAYSDINKANSAFNRTLIGFCQVIAAKDTSDKSEVKKLETAFATVKSLVDQVAANYDETPDYKFEIEVDGVKFDIIEELVRASNEASTSKFRTAFSSQDKTLNVRRDLVTALSKGQLSTFVRLEESDAYAAAKQEDAKKAKAAGTVNAKTTEETTAAISKAFAAAKEWADLEKLKPEDLTAEQKARIAQLEKIPGVKQVKGMISSISGDKTPTAVDLKPVRNACLKATGNLKGSNSVQRPFKDQLDAHTKDEFDDLIKYIIEETNPKQIVIDIESKIRAYEAKAAEVQKLNASKQHAEYAAALKASLSLYAELKALVDTHMKSLGLTDLDVEKASLEEIQTALEGKAKQVFEEQVKQKTLAIILLASEDKRKDLTLIANAKGIAVDTALEFLKTNKGKKDELPPVKTAGKTAGLFWAAVARLRGRNEEETKPGAGAAEAERTEAAVVNLEAAEAAVNPAAAATGGVGMVLEDVEGKGEGAAVKPAAKEERTEVAAGNEALVTGSNSYMASVKNYISSMSTVGKVGFLALAFIAVGGLAQYAPALSTYAWTPITDAPGNVTVAVNVTSIAG